MEWHYSYFNLQLSVRCANKFSCESQAFANPVAKPTPLAQTEFSVKTLTKKLVSFVNSMTFANNFLGHCMALHDSAYFQRPFQIIFLDTCGSIDAVEALSSHYKTDFYYE